MELRDALTQISEIRLRIDSSLSFRELRSIPTAATGLIAVSTALLQPHLIDDPLMRPRAWMALWVVTAAIAAVGTMASILPRLLRDRSSVRRHSTWAAVEQFLPAVIAGGLFALILPTRAPGAVYLLPGLWQIVFGLGIFSVSRTLPRGVAAAGFIYLGFGAYALTLSPAQAVNPWVMGLPFLIGQTVSAVVLFWSLERRHGR